jgi:hypothetical protein
MRLHRRPSPRSTENVNVLNRRVKPWLDFSSKRPPARSNNPPAGGERTSFIRQVRKNSHISPTHPSGDNRSTPPGRPQSRCARRPSLRRTRRGPVTSSAVIDKSGDTMAATSRRTPPPAAPHQRPRQRNAAARPSRAESAPTLPYPATMPERPAAEATARPPACLDLAARATGRWRTYPAESSLHVSPGPSGRPPSPTPAGLSPLDATFPACGFCDGA